MAEERKTRMAEPAVPSQESRLGLMFHEVYDSYMKYHLRRLEASQAQVRERPAT